MTPFNKVYDAFLSRILEDEWQHWMIEEAEQDWHQIMINALSWFKFPRTSLEYDEYGFINDLNNDPGILFITVQRRTALQNIPSLL